MLHLHGQVQEENSKTTEATVTEEISVHSSKAALVATTTETVIVVQMEATRSLATKIGIHKVAQVETGVETIGTTMVEIKVLFEMIF